MGLDISVGMLADLIINDEDGAQWLKDSIAKLNVVLQRVSLTPHQEPEKCDTYSIGTYGYSGLHHLRRVAAHLQYNGKLPKEFSPDRKPTEDALYARYGRAFEADNAEAQPGTFAAHSFRSFDHLIVHSDAEGYYVPQDFDSVLISGTDSFGWVGSSYALVRECERVAHALEIPRPLLEDGEDLAFEEAISLASKRRPSRWTWLRSKAREPAWKEHPVAAMLCAKLHNVGSHSIRTGALVVFC